MLVKPCVSVVMPVYNAEKYLAEAIRSILSQTYRNFEFLIIDDGSTDRSAAIAADFAWQDQRIRLIRQPDNLGLVAVLNWGLDLAQGKYIARMDADDISLPERLEKQIAYMHAHPEIGILGCKIQYIDETNKLSTVPVSFHSDLFIQWNVLFTNPFSHPAVVMRKAIIDQHQLRYDPQAVHVEDYEFWGRFLLVSEGENLPDVLLQYRIHPGSIGSTHSKVQTRLAAKISGEIIKKHLPEIKASPQEIRQWVDIRWEVSSLEFHDSARWMLIYLKLWGAFSRKHKGNSALMGLRRKVIPWAALYCLYPLFQPEWMKSVWFMTKVEWRWPFLFFSQLPYFYANRKRINFLRLDAGE